MSKKNAHKSEYAWETERVCCLNRGARTEERLTEFSIGLHLRVLKLPIL